MKKVFWLGDACVCVKSLQSCLTLCDSMDCSPPDSSVHGILQARILEWLPFPSPGDLPNPGIKPLSPALQTGSLPRNHQGSLRDVTYNNVVLSCNLEVFGSQMMNYKSWHESNSQGLRICGPTLWLYSQTTNVC